MTIFDAIKYPISDNPTSGEEYDSLPEHFHVIWRNRLDPYFSKYHNVNLKILRKIILEYDNDNI